MDSVAIVFDLDGTIWDSWPWYATVLAGISKADEARLRKNLFEGGNIVKLCRENGISNSRFANNFERNIEGLVLYPGVCETLSEFEERNIPLGIFTSLPGWIACPLLSAKNISQYFSSVVTASQVRNPKPNAEGLNEALSGLNLSINRRGIYVGDTNLDSLTAKNAGIDFAWATWGYDTEPPNYRIACLKKFQDILEI